MSPNKLFKSYITYTGVLSLAILTLLSGCANQAPINSGSQNKPSGSGAEQLNPSNAQDFALAVKLLKQPDAEKALPLFLKLKSVRPHHSGIQLNLANCYFLLGKYDLARNELQQTAKNSENLSQFENLQGLLAVAAGEYTQALSHYQAALAAPNPTPQTLYNLGLLYDIYWQNSAKALEYYQNYLSKVGGDKTLESWVTELKRKQRP